MSNKVTIWKDLSGKGNRAVGSGESRPEYIEAGIGGLPTIRFNNSRLSFENPLRLSKYSLFIVYKQEKKPSINTTPIVIGNVIYGFNTNGSRFSLAHVNNKGGKLFENTITTNTDTVVSILIGDGDPRLYINANQQQNVNQASQWGERVSAIDIVSAYGNFDISEILVYNRVLDENERQSIEEYIMTKYGINNGS